MELEYLLLVTSRTGPACNLKALPRARGGATHRRKQRPRSGVADAMEPTSRDGQRSSSHGGLNY